MTTTPEALRRAWDDLPAQLQAHPGIKALHRAALAALPAGEPAVKDHDVREAVNALAEVARTFHAAEQLRSRIQGVVLPLVARLRAAPTPAPAPGMALVPVATLQSIADSSSDPHAAGFARSAIAAAPAPAVQAEPYGWVIWWLGSDGRRYPIFQRGETRPNLGAELNALVPVVAVYEAATPQAAPAPLPAQAPRGLTEAELWANDEIMALNARHDLGLPIETIVMLVRAIERAHGITATPAKE